MLKEIDQEGFEKNAVRYMNVLASAMGRYKTVGCLFVDINLRGSEHANWSSFCDKFKGQLRTAILSHREVAQKTPATENVVISNIASKRIYRNKQVIHHAAFFFDAEGLVRERKGFEEGEEYYAEALLQSIITRVLCEGMTKGENTARQIARENSVEFLRFSTGDKKAWETFEYLLLRMKPNLTPNGYVGALRERQCPTSTLTNTFPSSTLLVGLETLHRYDKISRVRPMKADVIEVTEKVICPSIDEYTPLPETMKLIGTTKRYKPEIDFFPVKEGITVPAEKTKEEFPSGVIEAVEEFARNLKKEKQQEVIQDTPDQESIEITPPSNHYYTIVELLSRTEALIQSEGIALRKQHQIGDYLYVTWCWLLDPTNNKKDFSLLTLLDNFKKGSTLAQQEIKLKGKLNISVIEAKIIEINETEIKAETNGGIILTYRPCVDMTTIPVYHNYGMSRLYRWSKEMKTNKVIHYYELEFVLSRLLKYRPSVDALLCQIEKSLLTLCSDEAWIKEDMAENMRWMRIV